MRARWNHNIHYHPVVLRSVPPDAQRALDVGCGEGMLARALRTVVPHVTGIDLHRPSLDAARAYGDDITYLEGDFLEDSLETYDVVASVATLHHVDAAKGLRRLADLVRPGGVLVVIGLARPHGLRDVPYTVAALAAGIPLRLVKGKWDHPSPIVWPPPVTYTEMRALAGTLPGSVYRRHLLYRYSITWQKPR
jgi:2-polyprenyl-3-methyl-5-hydroxy-6-metoxy-1,4-benzoquinol methylase